mmetsp:Transcript_3125/g.4494  ORF Transcript_3125/g.4494 Transcript_3125/m.4494 type:complete len:609 (+) Transcript_3125:287-2113(+)
MCMQGHNYILALQTQEWETDTLAWQRIEVPPLYLEDNWPIRMVSFSESGMYMAVCGSQGAAVYSKATKKWTLFESLDEEKTLVCKMVFWWGDEILCIVHREKRNRVFELLCFSRDHLELSAVLGRATLPGRPLAVDTWFSEGVVVFQLQNKLCMYQMHLFNDDMSDLDNAEKDLSAPEEDQLDDKGHSDNDDSNQLSDLGSVPLKVGGAIVPNGNQPRKQQQFVIRRASSATEDSMEGFEASVKGVYVDLVETIPLTFDGCDESIEAPLSICLMPCSATRRAGTSVKFPKCAVLTSSGSLYVVDTDEGSRTCIAKGVYRIFPQSWSKVDQSDDVVLETFLESSVKEDQGSQAEHIPKLPAVLLYTIWVVDAKGLRLWLPALDINGESLETRCADAYFDVLPLGILESHGLVVGVTQRARVVTKHRVPCFEVAVRVTPTTHGLLQWLIQANKSDLASQVLVQASTHLPLFRETLDLCVFNAVENDYKNVQKGHEPALLPRTIELLRKGKIAAILDARTYDALVVTCARKMESSRWDLFFKYAGNPEQLFNDATYRGDLKTAAGSMIIADYFSPEKSSKRIASLIHAATLKNDQKLLAEINSFRTTKLQS